MTPMGVNPYQPPTVPADALASDEPASSGPLRRPRGIWVLAGLHLLAGLLFLVALVLFFYLLWFLRGELVTAPTDGPPTGVANSFYWFVAIICGLMAVLGLSSAIGLWRGARWGWWLAAFYYVWAVLGAAADFLRALPWFSQMDGESLATFMLTRMMQLVIHALILGYLFKHNVRAFFRLQSLRIDWALIPLAIIAILLLTASYLATCSQFRAPSDPTARFPDIRAR